MSSFIKAMLLALFCVFVTTAAFAQEEPAAPTDEVQTQPTSTNYIELGDGSGAVVIVGDGNAIYLPPAEEQICEPVSATYMLDGFVLILPETHIEVNGVTTLFSRIVLLIRDDGHVEILHAEQ